MLRTEWPRRLCALLGGVALASATPPPPKPGEGVLCLGTFIYFADKTAKQCHAGQDPEFQARISAYVRRFDEYIIRNTGGRPELLSKFKDGQGLNKPKLNNVCSGFAEQNYHHLKATPPSTLERSVNDVLTNDGPPSFGDCV